MAVDERYRLVFEEAVRSLSQQERSLDGLRGRAGTLIAATAISTSFLGGLVAEREEAFGGASVVAIVAFGLVVVLTLLILLPLWTWTFEVNAETLIEVLEGPEPPDQTELLRSEALWLKRFYDDNQKKINWLYAILVVAAVLLVVEIIAWLFALVR